MNPLFVSATTPDFHLQTGSPGIGTGTNAVSSIVLDDFDNTPRPANSAFDIGTYEFSDSIFANGFD